MKFVAPMEVTEANLTSNVVNDEPTWSAGTFNLGDRAVAGEYVYEVVADPNTTDQPSVGAAKATPTWILLGHSNIFRMWREGSDSPSEAVGDIEASIPVPTAISTVGLLNAVGLGVNVRLIDASIMNIVAPTIENVAGTKNGANTAFTITTAGNHVVLYLNGLKLTEGTDYNRTGTAITATGSIPDAGDTFVAEIFTADEPIEENIAGTKNGANTAFTISEAGGIAVLFLNGLKLTEGIDYNRTGTAITAIGFSIPESTDMYEVLIFVGNTPTLDNISGTKDGVNTTFLLSAEGVATVYLNMVRQVEGVDYEQDGISITATGGSTPNSGDLYEAVIYPDILFYGGIIYNKTKTLSDIGVGDWWEFFFTDYERTGTVIFDDLPAYFGPDVDVYVSVISTDALDPSSVGRVVIGKAIDAGQSLMGVTSRNLTFTQKTRDEFGNLTLVARRTIRVVDFPVMIPKGKTDYVQRQAAALAATPTLFIANPEMPETIVFGVFENFDVIISNLAVEECSIGVEEY